MKILHVDVFGDKGHGHPYRYAMTNTENENVYILPENVKDISGKVYIKPFRPLYVPAKLTRLKISVYTENIQQYLKWLKDIRAIADEEHPDIIHFVAADFITPFFGIGFNIFKGFKTVLSFHRFRRSLLRNLAKNLLVSRASAFTSHLMGAETCFISANRRKYNFIPYPSALESIFFTTAQAREFLNIHTDRKVIAFVGSMRSEKGIEVLLEALPKLKQPYYLVFAGGIEGNEQKELLEAKLEKIDVPKTVILRYISDEEFVACIAASDILAVPYLKVHEGTSGPMTEAIRLRKTIVGSSHSNIGQYIKNYGIGYSCEAGNVKGLTEALEKALVSPIVYTSEMEKLVESQTVQAFRRNLDAIYRSILQ